MIESGGFTILHETSFLEVLSVFDADRACMVGLQSELSGSSPEAIT